jgi:hypothetical protein
MSSLFFFLLGAHRSVPAAARPVPAPGPVRHSRCPVPTSRFNSLREHNTQHPGSSSSSTSRSLAVGFLILPNWKSLDPRGFSCKKASRSSREIGPDGKEPTLCSMQGARRPLRAQRARIIPLHLSPNAKDCLLRLLN